jgi:membrane protein DedA with SNARE-associated domain/membrane-associated phospholipid phosphatase
MIGHLLETYGYLAVMVLVGLESLGLPLPGETALLTASAYAAGGHLSIIGVVVAAVAGAVLGDAGAYWIGRTGGIALVRRYGRLLRIDDAKLERARRFYQRHGGKTVFFGRFVSLLRILAALLAGVTRMPYARFTLFNVAGGICWATLFGALGYALGRRLPALEHAVGQAGALVVLLAALVVVVAVVGPWLVHHAGDLRAGLSRGITRVGDWTPVRRVRERYPKAWTFLGRRFAAGEYLGLHLTVGLLLSLGALWLFGGVAEDVIHHDPLTQFDLTVADLLHQHPSPALTEIAKGVTLLGSPAVIAAWALIAVVVLVVRKELVTAGGLAAALLGGGLLDGVLKRVFHRPRPTWDVPIITAQGFSFPSGHAMGSLVAYGMLAYLAWRALDHPRARVALAACTVVLVLLIGLSRMYLGVHYFSDVVAGYAAGTVWLTACITGLEVVRRRPSSGALPSAGGSSS